MPTNTPTDSFINLAHAMLVALALVYLLIVIQVRLLFVTGRALDLSTLIRLLMLIMLRGIVVTNATVLRDFVLHEIEAGADVRTALMQGGRTHVCSILMAAPRPLPTPFRQ